MAAPTPTARGTPIGAHLDRPFNCKFTLGLTPTICLREFEITPGRITTGPSIRISTFFNTYDHTKVPQTLLDYETWKIKGLYDPDLFKGTGAAPLSSLRLHFGVVQTMTFKWPNASTLAFYGFVNAAGMATMSVFGTEAPAIELDIEVGNRDPVNRVEAGWVYTDGYSGTSDG